MKIIIQDIALHSRILWYVDKEHLSNCLPRLSVGHRREVKVCCSPIPYSVLDPNPTRFLHSQIIDYTYEGAQGGVRGDAASCCCHQPHSEYEHVTYLLPRKILVNKVD
jgi:hypothetical protein